MEKFIIDDSLGAKLEQYSSPIDLFDSTGKKVGCFIPLVDPSQYEPVTPLTREELDSIKQSSMWYTTEEVLRHLESL
jgi:hypothetical protein